VQAVVWCGQQCSSRQREVIRVCVCVCVCALLRRQPAVTAPEYHSIPPACRATSRVRLVTAARPPAFARLITTVIINTTACPSSVITITIE